MLAPIRIAVQRLAHGEGLPLPAYATDGAAGMDVVAAEALALRGIATDYRIVPGKGHDLLDDPEVLAATQRLAASLPRKI